MREDLDLREAVARCSLLGPRILTAIEPPFATTEDAAAMRAAVRKRGRRGRT